MFGWVAYRFRLRRLIRARRQVNRWFADPAHRHRVQHGGADLELHQKHEAFQRIEDEIAALQTDRLLVLADEYLIPRPLGALEPNETWMQARTSDQYLLSPAAIAELRASIRKEQRERSELVFRWLTGLTGVVGALIGLAALLMKHGTN
jgi:hypothetical protein